MNLKIDMERLKWNRLYFVYDVIAEKFSDKDLVEDLIVTNVDNRTTFIVTDYIRRSLLVYE